MAHISTSDAFSYKHYVLSAIQISYSSFEIYNMLKGWPTRTRERVLAACESLPLRATHSPAQSVNAALRCCRSPSAATSWAPRSMWASTPYFSMYALQRTCSQLDRPRQKANGLLLAAHTLFLSKVLGMSGTKRLYQESEGVESANVHTFVDISYQTPELVPFVSPNLSRTPSSVVDD